MIESNECDMSNDEIAEVLESSIMPEGKTKRDVQLKRLVLKEAAKRLRIGKHIELLIDAMKAARSRLCIWCKHKIGSKECVICGGHPINEALKRIVDAGVTTWNRTAQETALSECK